MPEPKTEILSPSDLNVLGNMEIKNEDVIAVAVARRERALEQRLLEAERAYVRLQRRMDEITRKGEKDLTVIVETEYANRVAGLKAAFVSFGQEVKVRLYPALNTEEMRIEVRIVVEPERGRNGDTSFHMERLTFNAPESLLTLYAEGLAIRDEVSQVINERVELKKALGNMATTERRARAALAEASLASSERGRALLAAMNDIPDLLTVPALEATILDTSEVKE
jgi:hypothetical protein